MHMGAAAGRLLESLFRMIPGFCSAEIAVMCATSPIRRSRDSDRASADITTAFPMDVAAQATPKTIRPGTVRPTRVGLSGSGQG